MQGLRGIITQSLKEAEWPYRDDGPPMAIGTSLLYDGMIIGGSIQIFDDIGVVRVIAFGPVCDPDTCRSELDVLIGLLNPTLLDVNFEVDLVLQMPVCRSVVRIDSEATVEEVAKEVIGTLSSVTANFVAVAPAFLGIATQGLSVEESLERVKIPSRE